MIRSPKRRSADTSRNVKSAVGLHAWNKMYLVDPGKKNIPASCDENIHHPGNAMQYGVHSTVQLKIVTGSAVSSSSQTRIAPPLYTVYLTNHKPGRALGLSGTRDAPREGAAEIRRRSRRSLMDEVGLGVGSTCAILCRLCRGLLRDLSESEKCCQVMRINEMSRANT